MSANIFKVFSIFTKVPIFTFPNRHLIANWPSRLHSWLIMILSVLIFINHILFVNLTLKVDHCYNIITLTAKCLAIVNISLFVLISTFYYELHGKYQFHSVLMKIEKISKYLQINVSQFRRNVYFSMGILIIVSTLLFSRTFAHGYWDIEDRYSFWVCILFGCGNMLQLAWVMLGMCLNCVLLVMGGILMDVLQKEQNKKRYLYANVRTFEALRLMDRVFGLIVLSIVSINFKTIILGLWRTYHRCTGDVVAYMMPIAFLSLFLILEVIEGTERKVSTQFHYFISIRLQTPRRGWNSNDDFSMGGSELSEAKSECEV